MGVWNGGTVPFGRRDLSYEDEKDHKEKAADFQIEEVRGYVLHWWKMRIRQSGVLRISGDDAFVRRKVPMTKEEARAVSIARMELLQKMRLCMTSLPEPALYLWETALSGEQIKVVCH